MKKDRVANPVIGRLPRYYRCVEELYLVGCVRVSSATLSQRLGFTASQIRQDFSNFGEFGQQGYGYNVRKLRYEIREILGLNSRNTAILVGCGNLGQALLKNFDFEACGLFILAAFDIDPAVSAIGTPVIQVVRDADGNPVVQARSLAEGRDDLSFGVLATENLDDWSGAALVPMKRFETDGFWKPVESENNPSYVFPSKMFFRYTIDVR